MASWGTAGASGVPRGPLRASGARTRHASAIRDLLGGLRPDEREPVVALVPDRGITLDPIRRGLVRGACPSGRRRLAHGLDGTEPCGRRASVVLLKN
jgi:hypothetical protein